MLIAAVDRRWSDEAEIIDTPEHISLWRTKHMCRVSGFVIFRSTNRPFTAPNRAVRSNHTGSSPDQPSISDVSLPDRSTASPVKVKQIQKKKEDQFLISSGTRFFSKIKIPKIVRKVYIFKTLVTIRWLDGLLSSYEEIIQNSIHN